MEVIPTLTAFVRMIIGAIFAPIFRVFTPPRYAVIVIHLYKVIGAYPFAATLAPLKLIIDAFFTVAFIVDDVQSLFFANLCAAVRADVALTFCVPIFGFGVFHIVFLSSLLAGGEAFSFVICVVCVAHCAAHGANIPRIALFVKRFFQKNLRNA